MEELKKKLIIDLLKKTLDIPFIECKEDSHVLCFGYSRRNQILYVCYKAKQRLYYYKGITQEEYRDLVNSESTGKWINANLVYTKREYGFKDFELKE